MSYADLLGYRHVVVLRETVERVDIERLRRLRQQMDAKSHLDEDLQELVVKDTLKSSLKMWLKNAGHPNVEIVSDEVNGLDPGMLLDEANARLDRGELGNGPIAYRPQEGVVVSKYVGNPEQCLHSSTLFHPGFDTRVDAQVHFMRCAQELLQQFRTFSDEKMRAIPPEVRHGVTLITTVLTPIMSFPKVDCGVELMCEFHQTTHMGQYSEFNIQAFEVFSETGDFPIQVPSDGDMYSMLSPMGQLHANQQS